MIRQSNVKPSKLGKQCSREGFLVVQLSNMRANCSSKAAYTFGLPVLKQ